jgi:hypothetical protein
MPALLSVAPYLAHFHSYIPTEEVHRMLKSTPIPETNPEETNHTVYDNETDANLGQPEAPSKSVERVVGGTTEDGGLRRRRVGRGGLWTVISCITVGSQFSQESQEDSVDWVAQAALVVMWVA